MRTLRPLIIGLATAALAFADESPKAPVPASFTDALTQGTLSLNLRLRYEGVQQDFLKDANALTLRTRLGFATAPFNGWSFYVEGDNIVAADPDAYSQAGLNAGGAGKAVVPDPESTSLNQAWVSFVTGDTTFKLGRQRLVLDNARFIGDSAWRQHTQTFDAFVVRNKSFDHTILTYAYLDRINRPLTDRHPQGHWHSESHLFNASYSGFSAGTLVAYAYLLDFDKAAYSANSSASYGLSFAGASALNSDLKLTYRVEGAIQRDYGSSTLDYHARYLAIESGLRLKDTHLAIGHEVLGSDNGIGFKTPLATLHAFDGWADLFPTTPADGLRDTYVRLTSPLPLALDLTLSEHWLETDKASARLGTEFDAMLSRKFGRQFAATLKFADFQSDHAAYPDVQKFWAQVEFAY